MKYLGIFFLICFTSLVLISGCEPQKKSVEKPTQLDSTNVRTVIYDSCEYIVVGSGSHRWGSHKGNCSNPIHVSNK